MQPVGKNPKLLSRWVKIMAVSTGVIGIPLFFATISDDFKRNAGYKLDCALGAVASGIRKLVAPAPKAKPVPIEIVIVADKRNRYKGPGKTPIKYGGKKKRTVENGPSPVGEHKQPPQGPDTSKKEPLPKVYHYTKEDAAHMKDKAEKAGKVLPRPLQEDFEVMARDGDSAFAIGNYQYEIDEYEKAFEAFKKAHRLYCSARYKVELE